MEKKKEANLGPILKLLLVDGKDHCATGVAQHSSRGHVNADTHPPLVACH